MNPEIEDTRELKKQSWGDGEWVNEPDFLEFEDRGYKCIVSRITEAGGHLCGYITLPENHPWRKQEYHEIDCEVHGGITFSEENEEGDHMIGFDCAHSSDICPGSAGSGGTFLQFMTALTDPINLKRHKSYKNMDFVIKELKKLVTQAIKAKDNK